MLRRKRRYGERDDKGRQKRKKEGALKMLRRNRR